MQTHFFLSVRIDFVLLLSVQSIQIFDILLIPAEQVSKSVDHIFSATYLSDSLSMPVLGFSFWQCSASWVWIEHFADDTDADVNLHKKLLGVKFCLLQRSDGLKKRRRRNLQMQIMLTKKPLTMLSRCVPNTLLNKMTIKGSERRHNESVSKCNWRDEKKPLHQRNSTVWWWWSFYLLSFSTTSSLFIKVRQFST